MSISATIVADSIANGKRITTWELEYPRFIHAELMTHRMFSRNAASSRAIPIEKTLEQVAANPAGPEEWGINQSGMQAKQIMRGWQKKTAQGTWGQAAKAATESAKKLQKLGLHKQIVNRVLEPFVHMKVVVTATEWNNWYHLRDHQDAQPEIRILAALMRERVEYSIPRELKEGEWHVPYVELKTEAGGAYPVIQLHEDGEEAIWKRLTWEEALKISSSCCAQVSYRLLDTSMEKAIKIYDMLVSNKPVHASPFEHQATPMLRLEDSGSSCGVPWEEGVTHTDRSYKFWSGNFQGWVQHRQLIKDNVVVG